MNRTIKRTLVVIVGILIVSGIIWFAVDRRQENSKKTGQETAIVSAPNPRIGEALAPDIQTPPAAAPEIKPTTKPPLAMTAQPRGTAPAYPRPTSTQPHIYRNTSLHFSVITPASWNTVPDARIAQEIFFINLSNQQQGSVEVYDAPAGENLNSLEKTLHGDPGAYNFERVSYRGQTGIGYWLKNDANEHFAFIVNGKIYYVHGENILSRMDFI